MKAAVICLTICISTLFGLTSFVSLSNRTSEIESSVKLRMVSYAKLNDCTEYGMTNFGKRMKFDYTQIDRETNKKVYSISRVDIVVNDKSYEIKGRKIPTAYIKEWKAEYEKNPANRIEMSVTLHLIDKNDKTRRHSTVFYLGDPKRVTLE